MAGESEYIRGTDGDELDRLGFQHIAWVACGHALWKRAGFGAGDVLADLGCGPGFTTFELAALVGSSGRVIARDASGRFLEYLAAEAARRGFSQIEPSLGSVEELELAPESLDGAYSRWLFSWPPEPLVGLARVAQALKPGAVLAMQEYFDWGAMRLVPASSLHERVVAACMRSWAEGGGTIDVGRELPELAAACDLVLEYYEPVARLGRVGSLEWRWLTGFFESYLPRLVERELLDRESHVAFREEWRSRTASGTGYCYTPTMVDGLLRKAR